MNKNYIDILKKSDKWFALHDINTFIKNEKLYIDIGGFELELSKDEIKELEIKIDRAWSDKSLKKLYKKIEVKRKKLRLQQETSGIFSLADFFTNKEDK